MESKLLVVVEYSMTGKSINLIFPDNISTLPYVKLLFQLLEVRKHYFLRFIFFLERVCACSSVSIEGEG